MAELYATLYKQFAGADQIEAAVSKNLEALVFIFSDVMNERNKLWHSLR